MLFKRLVQAAAAALALVAAAPEGDAAGFDMPVTTLKPNRFQALWPVAVKSVVLYGRIRDQLGV
jgi:hypothetical protein